MRIIWWSDHGPHFHCDLFWSYTKTLMGKFNLKEFLINFHIAGEGRCALDKYFGYLAALEYKFVLRKEDIVGKLSGGKMKLIYW